MCKVFKEGARATTNMFLHNAVDTVTPMLQGELHCNQLVTNASSQAFHTHLFLLIPQSLFPSSPIGKPVFVVQM